MSGWGSGSWGFSPWGSGADAPRLLSARAIRENCVRLEFSEAIVFDRTRRPRDGSRRELYGIAPVSGVSLDGEPVRPVLVARADAAGGAGTLVDLWTDRPLTGWPARYLAAAHGVWSTAGLPIDPAATSAAFDGCRALRPSLDPATSASLIGADVASPQTSFASAGGPLLGGWVVDATGDLAVDRGLAGLGKRLVRRVFAEPGSYAHLGPGYGAGLRSRVKRLASARDRADLARLVEDQCRREPEVAEASATVAQIGSQNAVRVELRVRTRFGQEASISLTAPT